MRSGCIKTVTVILLACAAPNVHAAESRGCSTIRSLIGAVLGGLGGTFVFPGVGTGMGAAAGAAAICGYDAFKGREAPAMTQVAPHDLQERTAAQKQ
jgi:outer membrane lipoprotein SlyB